MITVTITLTTAGSNTGPFNLYSDVDSYVTAFASGVSRSSLLGGYTSSNVPDGTTKIKIMSTGTCTNSLIMDIQNLPEQCYFTDFPSIPLTFYYTGGTYTFPVDTNDTYTVTSITSPFTYVVSTSGITVTAPYYYGSTTRTGVITVSGCDGSIIHTYDLIQIAYNPSLSLTLNINYYEGGNVSNSGLGGSYSIQCPDESSETIVPIPIYSKTYTETYTHGSGRYHLLLTPFHYINGLLTYPVYYRYRINGGDWINNSLFVYIDVTDVNVVVDVDISSTDFSEIETYDVVWEFMTENECTNYLFEIYINGVLVISKSSSDFVDIVLLYGSFVVYSGDLVELRVYNGDCSYARSEVGASISEIYGYNSWAISNIYINDDIIVRGRVTQ